MQKQRGRPTGSAIRQNLVEILFWRKKAYGYELYKYYLDIFPKVTMRVIYYHLKKGVATGEFEMQEIRLEKGTYSWGDTSEKKFYALSANAKPMGDKKVATYFEKLSLT
jgi:hypothetical protein